MYDLTWVTDEHVVWEYSPHVEPIHTVPSGTTLVVETRDALDGQVRHGMDTKPRVERANPATGPISVEGAEPDSWLAVDILAIDLPEEGYLTRGQRPTFISQRGGLAAFGPGFRLPLAPMIGTIGVMPVDRSYSTHIPGRHGGNMDTRDVAPGATLYLHVQRPGGLLALGDVHSVQGDGESSGQGIETSAKVTLRVRVLEVSLSYWPCLVKGSELMLIASHEDLDQAAVEAVEAMTSLILANSNLTYDDTRMLLGLASDIRVGQIVNALKTVRVAVPLNAVPWREPLHL